MRYNYLDFKELECMETETIQARIEDAKRAYEEAQVRFSELEEEMMKECILLKPDVSILIDELRNIESYIRKAENLLHDYDGYKYIQKIIAKREKKPVATLKLIKRGGEV